MKKNLVILLGIFLCIVVILTYTYYNYKKVTILSDKANKEYEIATENTIVGSNLMSIINKAINQNEKNGVQKDEQNRYIENKENSIKIEIKFLESDKTFSMEAIASLGSEQFVKNYSSMNFKCTKKEYHQKTNNIKYMLFEQINLDV